MKNAMQLKAIMKAVAKEKRISVQLVLQNYMLERLLERIALSRYRDNFILKGGFLIAAIVGLHTRATMDMDVTAKGVPVNADEVRRMFEEISLIAVDDGIDFRTARCLFVGNGDFGVNFKMIRRFGCRKTDIKKIR